MEMSITIIVTKKAYVEEVHGGRPRIFKLAVCADTMFLPTGKVTAIPGLDGFM